MKNRLKLKSGIDLAPLVDIVFLLLAYMLLNATLQKITFLDLVLPASGSATERPVETVVVGIDGNGELFLNGKPIILKDLIISLEHEERSISLEADREVPYHFVVEVLDALNRAGIKEFHLATENSVNYRK